jgi:hypothetical protein
MSNNEQLEVLRATNVALRRVLRECPQPDVAYVALVKVAAEVVGDVLLQRPALGERMLGVLRDAVRLLEAELVLVGTTCDQQRH